MKKPASEPDRVTDRLGSYQLSPAQVCRYVAEGFARDTGEVVHKLVVEMQGRLVETPQVIWLDEQQRERYQVHVLVVTQ